MTKSTSHLFYVQHINNNNTNRETRNSDFFLFVCVRFFCLFFFLSVGEAFLQGLIYFLTVENSEKMYC